MIVHTILNAPSNNEETDTVYSRSTCSTVKAGDLVVQRKGRPDLKRSRRPKPSLVPLSLAWMRSYVRCFKRIHGNPIDGFLWSIKITRNTLTFIFRSKLDLDVIGATFGWIWLSFWTKIHSNFSIWYSLFLVPNRDSFGGACFNCGQSGHRASDCPTKKGF